MDVKNKTFLICGIDVQPGEHVTLALPTPEIYTCAPSHIPMHVLNGKKAGPVLLICATLNGDEVNGIVILQRLLGLGTLKNLKGTLIIIPVMNVFGLVNHSRLLPDGWDLESSFPGSEKGSFSGRLAYLISSSILSLCTHCISIRSGGHHVYSAPHVIYPSGDRSSKRLAEVFETRVIRGSKSPIGVMSCSKNRALRPTIIFEGGEANRTDEWVVRTGLKGIVAVLRELQMIGSKPLQKAPYPYSITDTTWVRAPGSGLLNCKKKVGAKILKGEQLALITDPFGSAGQFEVVSPEKLGIITALNTHPLVNEGQGVIQIGLLSEGDLISSEIEIPAFQPDIID